MLECSGLAYLFLPEVYYFLIDENEIYCICFFLCCFIGFDIMFHDAQKVVACKTCAGYVCCCWNEF